MVLNRVKIGHLQNLDAPKGAKLAIFSGGGRKQRGFQGEGNVYLSGGGAGAGHCVPIPPFSSRYIRPPTNLPSLPHQRQK